MSTHFSIFFEGSNTNLDVLNVQKVYMSEDKKVQVRFSDGETIEVVECDFTQSRNGMGSRPDYSDGIYEYEVDDSNLYVKIVCKVAAGESMPEINPVKHEIVSFPTDVYVAENIPTGLEAPTRIVDWVPPPGFTQAEKDAIAVAEIENMFLQKERDIENGNRYLDLNPDIPKHIAYWWRAAVAVIKRFFQDTSVDRLIVAEMAKQAAAGPTTRDQELVLLRNLMGLIAQFPNGPDFAAIWVETRNLTSPSDVRRKTILEVLATRGTPEDETYPMPADFDSTDESWLVVS